MRLLSCLAILIACSALLATRSMGQARTDRNRDQLVGPVRSVHRELVEVSIIDGKAVETRRRPHQSVTYNKSGCEIERVNYNEDGSISSKSVQLYDSTGRQIGWKEFGDANGDGSEARRASVWKYDQKGNRTEVLVYNWNLLELRMTYNYDDRARMTEESRFADNGTYHQRSTYAYNAAGQTTEAVYYYNEILSDKSVKTYDKTGNLVKEAHAHLLSPESFSTAEYDYDGRGREIERRTNSEILWSTVRTSYDKNGRAAQRETFMGYNQPNLFQSHAPEPGRLVFSYDKRGNVIQETFYGPDQSLVSKTISTYNQSGALIEQTYLRKNTIENGKVCYEYDPKGNWIKATHLQMRGKGWQAVNVEHRAITYYKPAEL